MNNYYIPGKNGNFPGKVINSRFPGNPKSPGNRQPYSQLYFTFQKLNALVRLVGKRAHLKLALDLEHACRQFPSTQQLN